MLIANVTYEWSISGLAWINVDSTCRLHYQVRLNAGKKDTEAKILLQDHPMQNLKVGTYLRYPYVLQNSVVKKKCIKLTIVKIDNETIMYLPILIVLCVKKQKNQ